MRLENHLANHDKFWEITDKVQCDKSGGCTIVIEWGRIGTAGQRQEKRFLSRQFAEKFIQDKIQEKIGRGYLPAGAKHPQIVVPMISAAKPGLLGGLEQPKRKIVID